MIRIEHKLRRVTTDKGLLDIKQHDVQPARLKNNRLSSRQNYAAVNWSHAHHAITVQMFVELNTIRQWRACTDNFAVCCAMISNSKKASGG
jgi:hypothetical protein